MKPQPLYVRSTVVRRVCYLASFLAPLVLFLGAVGVLYGLGMTTPHGKSWLSWVTARFGNTDVALTGWEILLSSKMGMDKRAPFCPVAPGWASLFPSDTPDCDLFLHRANWSVILIAASFVLLFFSTTFAFNALVNASPRSYIYALVPAVISLLCNVTAPIVFRYVAVPPGIRHLQLLNKPVEVTGVGFTVGACAFTSGCCVVGIAASVLAYWPLAGNYAAVAQDKDDVALRRRPKATPPLPPPPPLHELSERSPSGQSGQSGQTAAAMYRVASVATMDGQRTPATDRQWVSGSHGTGSLKDDISSTLSKRTAE